jgi:hypothetical protein
MQGYLDKQSHLTVPKLLQPCVGCVWLIVEGCGNRMLVCCSTPKSDIAHSKLSVAFANSRT